MSKYRPPDKPKLMGRVIDFARFKAQRQAEKVSAAIFAWSPRDWPFCRVRYFVRATRSGRPPRCCCGRTYDELTLRARGPLLASMVRETLSRLGNPEDASMHQVVGALLANPELTSVERAALSTGPCASCPVLAEQTQQLRFLWGLYRAYWGRAVSALGARGHQGQLAAMQSRQSAVDLRRHIRHEISLIRSLQRQLAVCPWARHHQRSHAVGPSVGC